jgi:chromosome segregation ATPase
MHSAHRDLETKFKRCRQDLAEALNEKNHLTTMLNNRNDEITELKTNKTDLEGKLTNSKEKGEALQRDIKHKIDQLRDFEARYTMTLDNLDNAKYKIQDMQKDLTEMKLKTDVLTSTNDGLANEKQHLVIELKETREL